MKQSTEEYWESFWEKKSARMKLIDDRNELNTRFWAWHRAQSKENAMDYTGFYPGEIFDTFQESIDYCLNHYKRCGENPDGNDFIVKIKKTDGNIIKVFTLKESLRISKLLKL
jgi:hypothetical protein